MNPAEPICWTKLPRDAKVVLRGSTFWYGEKFVCWSGESAQAAMDFLIHRSTKEDPQNAMKSGITLKISDEVMAVLKRSTITENQLVLPPGRLERKLYESVAHALELAGGKWNTKAQAHVFESDPRPKLGLLMETGTIVDEKKRDQAFYTPKELANHVVMLAEVSGMEVLEPSAGGGALMEACLHAGAKHVCGIELNEEVCQKLHTRLNHWGANGKGPYSVVNRDFLNHPAPNPANALYRFYDRVVMNPPFTRGQDLKHIAHALQFLKPGGRLVAIMAAGKTTDKIKAIVNGHKYHTEDVPAGAFKESGTNIRTTILVINT